MKRIISLLLVAVLALSTMLIGINAFAASECSVVYNVNTDDSSVAAPASQTVEYGGTITVAEPPARTGYTMTEWNTSPDGNGVSYEPGDAVTLMGSITLYAVWSETGTSADTTGGSSAVAKMYICASIRNIIGHVWLYFINLCDHDIQVGYITLKPGETTSVGSLRNSRTDGGGTYYNAEAYMLKGKSGSIVSMSMDLDESQLETVSAKIRSKNSYNLILGNCGNFAAAVWNSVSDKKIVHIVLPVFTVAEILLYGGKLGAPEMKTPDISDCYKQVSGGVKQASRSSFNVSCL